MSDNQNSALTRLSASKVHRRFWSPNVDSPGGALAAARDGWWGGGWLAISGLFDAGLSFMRYSEQPSLLSIALAIDVVLVLVAAGLGWLIWARQPLWAIIVILTLLVLNLVVALITLHIGIGTIINGVLIYSEINAIRGNRRLAAFRRGDLTPQQAGRVFE
jgi:hypothetical protein